MLLFTVCTASLWFQISIKLLNFIHNFDYIDTIEFISLKGTPVYILYYTRCNTVKTSLHISFIVIILLKLW